MSFVRKLVLLAVMAVAAMALAAPSAFAQEGVEVEATGGDMCGGVTPSSHGASGGCTVEAHASGVVLTAHLSPTFEVPGSICDNEFTGHVDAAGEGYITDQVLSGGDCTTPPCSEGAGAQDPWDFHIQEETPSDAEQEVMYVHFCVVSSTFGPIDCEIEVDVNGGAGNYSFEAEDRQCTNQATFPRFEVTGHWLVEDQSIEIHHDNDV